MKCVLSTHLKIPANNSEEKSTRTVGFQLQINGQALLDGDVHMCHDIEIQKSVCGAHI